MPVRVLVVDDSNFFQHRLKDIINEHPDLKVIGIASNGREAVEKAEQLKPDIITMDFEMPVMDGVTAIKLINGESNDFELENVLKNLELYDVENDPSERINLAKQHPEIIEKLLEEYENWFDEVTEERDARGIQRIHLGTEAQLHTNLSRFDWGGPRVISRFDYGGPIVIEDNQLGHWQVTTEAGTYEVSADLPKVEKDCIIHFKYNEIHLKLPINKGQKKVIFANIKLPKGEGNFHVYLKNGRLPEGPLFVDVKKIK